MTKLKHKDQSSIIDYKIILKEDLYIIFLAY